MTQKQRYVLQYIIKYTTEEGVPPSLQDIGDHFGISRQAADARVRALEVKGYLKRRVKGRARNIRVIDSAQWKKK